MTRSVPDSARIWSEALEYVHGVGSSIRHFVLEEPDVYREDMVFTLFRKLLVERENQNLQQVSKKFWTILLFTRRGSIF